MSHIIENTKESMAKVIGELSIFVAMITAVTLVVVCVAFLCQAYYRSYIANRCYQKAFGGEVLLSNMDIEQQVDANTKFITCMFI